MLEAVAVTVTARESIVLVHAIGRTMQHYKQEIRDKASKLYSQDILNNLFRYPYTRIEYLMHDLQVSRNTAIRYLDSLIELNLIEKKKIGRDNFYLNKALVDLWLNHFRDNSLFKEIFLQMRRYVCRLKSGVYTINQRAMGSLLT